MQTIMLIFLALLPCAILLYLILYMDRNEREPLSLVLKVMAWGAVGFIPAVLIEGLLGNLPVLKTVGLPGAVLDSFLSVAPAEELCKLAPVLLLVWKDPNFNEENDGIVYAGASALGFALVENVFYVLSKGWAVGVMRAVSSIPLHCFAGIVMGYYLGRARFDPGRQNRLIATGFFWAYLAHGFYNTFCFSGSYLALLLLPMIAVIAIIGLKVLRKGREESLLRSSPANIPPEQQAERGLSPDLSKEVAVAGPPASGKPTETWKAVVGRTLLSLCLAVWALLILGLCTGEKDREPGRAGVAILGGVIITVIPAGLALALEYSYRKARSKKSN
jgi:RsiW-degrading membrane proteinase PrsW (M82 family)